MVLKTLNPYEDELNDPRNKTSESIEIIISDLDKAIAGLPPSWPDAEIGRITKGAAAAMKGRILLYWASPQYNVNNDPARWERAYLANKEAKTILVSAGKALHGSFNNIFLVEGSANKEAVLVRPFNLSADVTNSWENSARPREVGGNGGGVNPTLGLVSAFPMKNGKAIADPTSGYDPVHFWKDRDPRFYSTIVYNGATYEFPSITGGSGRKQWTYYYYEYRNGAPTTTLKSVETNGPTVTGFYTRKMVNPNIAQVDVSRSGTDWIEIRFAEVLLNLAEAANEAGHIDEAYTEMREIRKRAGIESNGNTYGLPDAMTKEQMRAAIMNERQVELAYEDKRYWDLRRRNMFAEDLPGVANTKLNGTKRLGIRIILKPEYNNADFVNIRNNINLDTDFDTYFTVEVREMDPQPLNYRQPAVPGPNNPSYNFFPIQTSLINRSPALKQTQGWAAENTFNPFE